MHEESISQAEIDALVRGATHASEASFAPGWGSDDATLLKEPVREYAGHAGRALADLVGAPSDGTLADLIPTTAQGVGAMVQGQVLVGKVALTTGLTGTLYFVVPTHAGLSMITQIYGGVAPSALDDSALGALSDGLTQMNHVGLTRLAEHMGYPVYAGPVEVQATNTPVETLGITPATPVMVAAIDLSVGDEGGRIFLIITRDLAAPIIQAERARASARGPSRHHGAAPAAPMAPAPAAPAAGPSRMPAQAAPAPAAAAPVYQPARFPEVPSPPRLSRDDVRNIDVLMDVTLQVTVELGRTRRQIRDVLSLGPGSVLELDKLAGEQVDVLVNGKLLAKGEVVVIDENYGVRITDIISPVERVQSLR